MISILYNDGVHTEYTYPDNTIVVVRPGDTHSTGRVRRIPDRYAASATITHRPQSMRANVMNLPFSQLKVDLGPQQKGNERRPRYKKRCAVPSVPPLSNIDDEELKRLYFRKPTTPFESHFTIEHEGEDVGMVPRDGDDDEERAGLGWSSGSEYDTPSDLGYCGDIGNDGEIGDIGDIDDEIGALFIDDEPWSASQFVHKVDCPTQNGHVRFSEREL